MISLSIKFIFLKAIVGFLSIVFDNNKNMLKQAKKQSVVSLQKETKAITKEFSKLKTVMPSRSSASLLMKISDKFSTLQNFWQSLSSLSTNSITNSKTRAKKYLRSMKSNKNVLENIQEDKKRIKSQETILQKREIRLERSLDKFKGLWQENISDMESSLKSQKDTLLRISEDYFSTMKKIEAEIKDVLEGPTIPPLNLEKLHSKVQSIALSNQKFTKNQSNSNRSLLLRHDEDIASFRSHSSRIKHKKRKENLKFKEDNEKTNNFSANLKNLRMNERSEDSVSMQEIKEALFILKKANLINNSGNAQLLKIAELVKDPENTSNVELMLQLIEIENRKNYGARDRQRVSSNKNQIRAHRAKRSKFDDLDDTSREKFKMSEEKSFNKTLLSNENLLSPVNYDEGLDTEYAKEELNDVKLEDLLNVKSLIEDLGLVSADNSMCTYMGDETVRDKELFNLG